MVQYDVTGMSCAACSARVEKAVKGVEGVSSCAVNLLTNSMGVEGTASPQQIIAAVEAAGYGAAVKGAPVGDAKKEEADPVRPLRRRLLWSIGFLAVLMYFSMGHMMFGWPLPAFYRENHIAMGLTQLLLAGIVMVINQRFFISGFKALGRRAPNMDTLVALGSAAAFVYSTVALFAMTGAQVRGDGEAVMKYMMEFYFESAAMILTLITVGKLLEAHAKGKTTNALKALMRLSPQTATVVRDGKEQTVPVEQVRTGDVFLIRPGERIPADGTVNEGESAVDESALTGESLPVDKTPGSAVSAGTVNTSGYLRCIASRVGEETTLSQIIRMVSDAAATKAPIAKTADKVAGIFVPAVMGIALITTVVWTVIRGDFGFALARGISVLVISCPCALGLATPVAIMVGNGVGAKNGILFKTAVSLEQEGKTRTVVLDKTGTVTEGQPRVTDLIPAEGVGEEELLTLALALEEKSEHPLARAIREEGQARGLTAPAVTDFTALPGNGLTARLDGDPLTGGNAALIERTLPLPEAARQKAEALANEGKTPLFFARANRFLGTVAVADVIKPDSPQAIRELHGMGIRVILLTGDNPKTAKAVGDAAGVDQVIAGVLPDGKEEVIRRLQEQGPVTMVGDGINDAPALTRADVGMAIGTGTDVAVDSADVVLTQSRLTDVAAAIRLSRATLRNIRQNLFWAFFYNAVCIPIAAGVFVAAGLTLDPMFGAAAMSLSSFCVVTNALRLNRCRIRDPKHDRKIKQADQTIIQNEKEKESMETILQVKGMMCPHCEAHVKTALEAVPGVTEATADHNTGTVTLRTDAPVPEAALKQAVEQAGYEFVSKN